jgi:RNA 2',3'-cyclic 3'-phosphodiesterase
VARLQPVADGVAWVGADNFHLTLKFLGGVETGRVDAVVAGLTGAAAGCPAFDVAVRGLGAFPSPTRPRVLWAAVAEGAAAMSVVARRVDEALGPLGFEPETRAFSPHVTLGRVRVPRSSPRLAEALADGGEFGRQRVDRLVLMRSELSPRGPRYTELAMAPLAAGSPG